MLFEATSIVQRSNLHFIGEKVRGGRMLFACCGCIVAALLYKLLYCGWQTDLTLLRHGVVFTTVVNRLRCKVGLIAVHRKLHPFCARFCMVGFSRIHYIAMYCIVCAAMQCGLDSRVKPLRHWRIQFFCACKGRPKPLISGWWDGEQGGMGIPKRQVWNSTSGQINV